MLKSNVDPDEAIFLYDSLLLAQEGLVLDSWLHLLYLVTPLDHRVYPNLPHILSLYEKSKQFANIIKVIGDTDSVSLAGEAAESKRRGHVQRCG